MEQTSVHPDEVLRALLDKGPRSQKATNLNALHSVCAAQYAIKNQAMRDFSLPAIGRICEENGTPRRFINIYLNEEDIRFLDGEGTAVKDGDEISIIPAIAGGVR